LEIKNELLPKITRSEVEILGSMYAGLSILNLSMNKIANIEASFSRVCPSLKEIYLNDNLLKSINP